MKNLTTIIAILGLAFCVSTTVQAQGYCVNNNSLYGNCNKVSNVNTYHPAPVSQPMGPGGVVSPYSVQNHNHVSGNFNQIANVNQTGGSGTVFNQNTIQGNNNTVANVNQMNSGGPTFFASNFPTGPSRNQTTNINQIQGNNNTIVNAVQNGISNGLSGIPGQAPIVNVNININTIIGDNNQIVNTTRR